MLYRVNYCNRIDRAFLKKVMETFHYSDGDEEELVRVSGDVISSIRHQERIEIIEVKDELMVGITLGDNVDRLFERYSKEGRILCQLMAENICDELLMLIYSDIEAIVYRDFGYSLSGRLHFYGSEEAYPISGLSTALGEFKGIKIECTEGMCLKPSKSVVFCVNYGRSDGKNKGLCTDLCANCNNVKCVRKNL